jgi:Fe-S-cluster containining protein
MRDGPLRRAVKRVALWNFMLGVHVERAFQRRRGRIPFVLGGECRRCARCCEAPGIQVGRLIWYLPALRRLFLWWQREVNGWEVAGRDVGPRVFVFKCTHFDWATRSCDSYDSRPGACRDYPRALLGQAAPEFLPGCGYRPVAVNSRKLLRALEEARVTPAQMDRLREALHLEKEE